MWGQKSTVGEVKMVGGKQLTLLNPDGSERGHYQALGNKTPNILLKGKDLYVHHGVDGYLRLVAEDERPLMALADSNIRMAEKTDG